MITAKIESCRVTTYHIPLETPFAAGQWVLTEACNAVVKLRSHDGVEGIGYAFTFNRDHTALIARTIEILGSEIIGKDAMSVATLRADLFQSTNFLGHGGVVTSAIGALDTALWDIKAKTLGVSLYRLLGGDNPQVPVYASGGPHNQTEDQLARELEKYREEGFKAVKIKVSSDAEAVVNRVALARDILGDDIELMVDANQAWSFKQTVDLAERLQEYRIYWLEEPLPYWQLTQAADLRRRLSVKLALGETLYGERQLISAVEVGASDVIMPNLQKVGGVTGWLEVAQAAAQRGYTVSSHTFCEMSGHLMACVPNGEYMEYMPWWRQLFKNPFDVVDGCLVLPETPGLGLELDDKVFANQH